MWLGNIVNGKFPSGLVGACFGQWLCPAAFGLVYKKPSNSPLVLPRLLSIGGWREEEEEAVQNRTMTIVSLSDCHPKENEFHGGRTLRSSSAFP